MKRIKKGIAIPSAAYTVPSRLIKSYQPLTKKPVVGDVIYGMVSHIGEHSSLENKSGRIHMIHNGSLGIFVYGNRYAPDYFEGVLPSKYEEEVDLLARSGLIGQVKTKNAMKKDPTRIKVLGYVCDSAGKPINTIDYPVLRPKLTEKKKPRAKLILVCGTAMNSGKSMAATACCWSLSAEGYTVRGTKVTGTASLKDILNMNDAGADHYADFTHLGYPSTYMLSQEQLEDIFNKMDLKYANNPKNYWVVEFADGILQRETAMLLQSEVVRSRIHRLIFCAGDAFGAIGGLDVLKEKFNLVPDAISGVCSSSPLHLRELAEFTNLPVFNSANADVKQLNALLTTPKKRGKV